MNNLAKKIETLLFVSGEGLSMSAITKQLKESESAIHDAIDELKNHLTKEHFLTILEHEGKVSIVSANAVSTLVEEFAKEEFSGELTRAALETLAIIAYKGPIRRVEIDFIRGVNSSFMLRNLLIRGLIERAKDEKDARTYAYNISHEFLKYLGISSLSELPEFSNFSQKLEEFISSAQHHE